MFGPHEEENMFKYFRIIDQFGRIILADRVDVHFDCVLSVTYSLTKNLICLYLSKHPELL